MEAAAQALAKYGTGSGGSRLVSGSSDLHAELESKIAEFKSTEAAILFSSGYLANVGTIAALVGEGDTVFSDELNHASIIDGCRLSRATVEVYPHLDTDSLEQMVSRSRTGGKKLIVTDTVFSMDGDLTDLGEICSISERYGCMLMVDEAHAMGVLGEKGSGATEHFGGRGQGSRGHGHSFESCRISGRIRGRQPKSRRLHPKQGEKLHFRYVSSRGLSCRFNRGDWHHRGRTAEKEAFNGSCRYIQGGTLRHGI